jgi:hypothetical protein
MTKTERQVEYGRWAAQLECDEIDCNFDDYDEVEQQEMIERYNELAELFDLDKWDD